MNIARNVAMSGERAFITGIILISVMVNDNDTMPQTRAQRGNGR